MNARDYLEAQNRWWVLSDSDLVAALLRVERGEVSAAEVYAMLLEHSDVDARSANPSLVSGDDDDD